MDEILDHGFVPAERAEAHARATFLKRTYSHVALAVLGFVVVESIFLSIPAIVGLGLSMTQGYTWLIVLGGFMLVTNLAEKWAHTSTDKGTQYGALALYVVAEAFIFVPLLAIATSVAGAGLISQAAIITLTLFTGLSAVALTTGKDFSFLKSGITVMGFIAIGLIVAGLIFGFNLGLWFSVAMVGLAGMSILYQTSKILKTYHTSMYVAAALGLFASLMLMFWYVITILMRFAND